MGRPDNVIMMAADVLAPDHQQPPCWLDYDKIVPWIVSNNTNIAFQPQIQSYNEVIKSATRYSDVRMSAMASQITGISTVCSVVCSGAHQRKYQISASLAFVRGIHRSPVDSPHKWPVNFMTSPCRSFRYNWRVRLHTPTWLHVADLYLPWRCPWSDSNDISPHNSPANVIIGR